MNRESIHTIAAAIAVLGLLSAGSVSIAQPGRGPGGPNYDPKTELAFEGTVTTIQEASREGCPQCTGGVHLVVEGDAETFEVHVGPKSFLDEKGWKFAEGEVLEIVGSKVQLEGKAALIARRITRGEEVLILRDEHGMPLWKGGRRRTS